MSLITEYESTVMQAQTFSQLENNGQHITGPEIEAAQQAWCDGLVTVSQAYNAGSGGNDAAMTTAANLMITELYDYLDGGNVFFRPTLTNGAGTFRPTYNSALSYFVGSANVNWPGGSAPPAYAGDTGFAKNPITAATFINTTTQYATFQIFGNIGITMGNVTLTLGAGSIVVDKTFIFRKDAQGNLKIILHKSALSNTPAAVPPYPP